MQKRRGADTTPFLFNKEGLIMDIYIGDIVVSKNKKVVFIPDEVNSKKVPSFSCCENYKDLESVFEKYVGYKVKIKIVAIEGIDDKIDSCRWNSCNNRKMRRETNKRKKDNK